MLQGVGLTQKEKPTQLIPITVRDIITNYYTSVSVFNGGVCITEAEFI